MAKIFCGNVHFNADLDELQNLFLEFGVVHEWHPIMDRDSGEFRGYVFVTMDDTSAQCAILALNGWEFMRRPLVVNIAREREPRVEFKGGGRPDSRRQRI